MREIIYISMCTPFDNVGHAGGKTLNFYINKFSDELNVTIISKVLPDEKEKINLSKTKYRQIYIEKNHGLKRGLDILMSMNSKVNPLYKYGNTLLKATYLAYEKALKKLKVDGYKPDIVILEWTEMLLFIDVVKRYFPNAKYVSSEHDVSFLGKQRLFQNENNKLKRFIKYLYYKSIKKHELQCINKCDLTVTHNFKDYNLLLENGINNKKLGIISPYYDNFKDCIRRSENKDILFYGAMNRKENYLSAIWFIDNVMPLLTDLDVRFIVIGNKPPKCLLKKQSKSVVITGFIEDISSYFSTGMCLVAPLKFGAGIKVKILEALSSGIIVLTNSIGIEGINMENKKHYLHCESSEEYSSIIREIYFGHIDTKKMCNEAKNLIETEYNLEESYKEYKKRIESL